MSTQKQTECWLTLSSITTDPEIQQRAVALDDDAVERYSWAIEESKDGEWPFPPVIVFRDGDIYLLADGFHRIAAAKIRNLETVQADVRQGTRDDAILFATSANSTHGLPRTNADKRKAVTTLLNQPDWKGWTSREIARHCAVSHTFVNNIRAGNNRRENKKMMDDLERKWDENLERQNQAKVETVSNDSEIRTNSGGNISNDSEIGTNSDEFPDWAEADPQKDPETPETQKPKQKAITPKKAAQQALHRFAGACSDIDNVDLTDAEKKKVVSRAQELIDQMLPAPSPEELWAEVQDIVKASIPSDLRTAAEEWGHPQFFTARTLVMDEESALKRLAVLDKPSRRAALKAVIEILNQHRKAVTDIYLRDGQSAIANERQRQKELAVKAKSGEIALDEIEWYGLLVKDGKRIQRLVHPDKHNGSKTATEMSKILNKAMERVESQGGRS